jgi:hypothetical protein
MYLPRHLWRSASTMDEPEIDLAMAWSPVEQGRGPGSLSGGDRQGAQPFELADFLAKAAHARAVVGLQPHRGREIAV